jgi:hypothetical protein
VRTELAAVAVSDDRSLPGEASGVSGAAGRANPDNEAVAVADQVLRRLAVEEGRCRLLLGDVLEVFRKRRAHVDLGFVRLGDYTRERLGISGSEAETLARTASRLRGLPVVRHAFEHGDVGWTKARLLAAVATPPTQFEWLVLAFDATARELENEIHVRKARETASDEAEIARSIEAEIHAMQEEDGDAVDDEPRVHFRMGCPGPVWVLFHRVVELARRMTGDEGPLWRAVEAITAEGMTGAPNPICEDDLECEVGRRLDSRFGGGGFRPMDYGPKEVPSVAPADAGAIARAAERLCLAADDFRCVTAELDDILADGDVADPAELDARLREIARERQRIDARIGRLLSAMVGWKNYRRLGFSSLDRYVRDRLGISVRKAWALVALADYSEQFPELGECYREGEVSWVRALTLLPLARVGEDLSLGWLERARQVTVRRLGDDVGWALEAQALFGREARGTLPPLVGDVADPAESVQMRVDGRPPRRFLQIDFSGPVSLVADFHVAMTAWTDDGEPRWRGLSRMLVHVAGQWLGQARHRDPVFARDGWRCRVPCCTSRQNLQDHHVEFRSRGGGNELDNRASTCSAHHHHTIHTGRVQARGKAGRTILWELGVRKGRPPFLRFANDVYLDRAAAT